MRRGDPRRARAAATTGLSPQAHSWPSGVIEAEQTGQGHTVRNDRLLAVTNCLSGI